MCYVRGRTTACGLTCCFMLGADQSRRVTGRSGRNIWVGQAPVTEPGRELALKRQRLGEISLEERDEQGEQQEVVRPQLEQRDVVVGAQGIALRIGEAQPGAPLAPVAVQDHVRLLRLPPGHGAARVPAVALDQVRVTVDGEQELVDQVLAHEAPSGYQVK